MPVPPRFFKYAIITFIALLSVGFWTRSEFLPTISQYAIVAGDSIDIIKEQPLEHPQHQEHNEDIEEDSEDSSEGHFGLYISDEPNIYGTPGTPGTPGKPGTPSSPNVAAPSSSGKPAFPKFAKITATFGEPDPPYENAIASHKLHNEIHGYPHFILREQMLKGLWSKHAYILSIIGNELAKPEEQRLQWVMWHDRDTVLMNPQLPLDIFVPPSPSFNHIHFLVTNDRNGLNNGVFLCRVSAASFKFFASSLSIREYRPELELKYTEQSGMEEVIKTENWNSIIAYVPQRWFNGFMPTDRSLKQGRPSAARPGSLLIHFASNRDGKRPERMAHWGEVAKNRTAEWDKPVEQTGYLKEIAEYWDRLEKGETQENIIRDIEGRHWN